MAQATWPVFEGRLVDYSLIIAFTLPFRLDTICTSRPLLSTLEPSLATRQTSSFGSFSHLGMVCTRILSFREALIFSLVGVYS
jgi:hypothetical protein